MTNTKVMETLLTLLANTLSPLVVTSSDPKSLTTIDPHLSQWLILLISHILASIDNRSSDKNEMLSNSGVKKDSSLSKSVNLFVPMLSEIHSTKSHDTTSCTMEEFNERIAKFQKASGKIKECLEKIDAIQETAESKMMVAKNYNTNLVDLKVDLERKLDKLQKISQKYKSTGNGTKDRSSRETRSSEPAVKSKDGTKDTSEPTVKVEPDSHALSSMGLSVPSNLVIRASQGLVHLLVCQCQNGNWENVPVVCKVSVVPTCIFM